jgi:hypothetical protein
MNKVEAILEDLRKITMLTGELSSVHQESLQSWPLILFDDVKNVEIKYDLTKDRIKEVGEGYIYFDIETNEKYEFKDECEKEIERSKILVDWVRDMFWPEIFVRVTINNRYIYDHSSKIQKNVDRMMDGLKND